MESTELSRAELSLPGDHDFRACVNALPCYVEYHEEIAPIYKNLYVNDFNYA